MEFKVKPFGIGRYWDYLKVIFFIMYKRLLEYKANFWSSWPLELIYFISMIFFYRVIFDNFESGLFWTFEDFILHMILAALLFGIGGIFMWKELLFEFIKSGELNQFLVRPMNRIYLFYTSSLASPAVVFILTDIIALIFFFLYFDIHTERIFFSFLVSILILLFYLVIYFFMLFPIFFIGTLLIPILRGYDVWRIELQFSILIGLIILFFSLTRVMWHYGLKKYEVFG